MKSRHTLLAALGVALLGGAVTMACTSPERVFGTNTSGTGTTSTGTGASSGAGGDNATSSGTAMTSSGTGTISTVPCTSASSCTGKDTECQKRVCSNGFCGIEFIALGTPLTAQFTGDCQQIVCDGQGSLGQQPDSADVPDDSNPCTQDVCTAGVPSHTPATSGTQCGVGLTCNALGNCIGCMAPADCPGTDTDCRTRSCKGTICSFDYQPSGTKTVDQTAGDCKQNVCNGIGSPSVTFDPMDPSDDFNDCTLDACSNGSPTHGNLAPGGTCISSDKSKGVCDGTGVCVTCVTASDCNAQDTECATPTCVAGKCGFDFVASGTPVALQTGGDCKKSVCDGNGGVIQSPDDSDLPQDGNPCTGDTCSGGVIGHAPVAMGTDCGAPKQCDGAGNCAGCLNATDCAGQDTECLKRTCNSGVCGLVFTPYGTAVASQLPSDCQKSVCDGSGNTTIIADNSDVKSDGAECTLDQCAGGSPSFPPAPVNTPCTVGGTVCNGIGGCGVCTPGTSIDCGCGTKSSFCCNPIPISSPGALPDQSDDTGNPTNAGCCCFDQYMDCDASGQWGVCHS